MFVATDSEEDAPARRLGKWAKAGVPHRGWTCVDWVDLGEPAAICEMCEHQYIRYVHVLRHPEWPDQLRCGCVCSGNMEQDLVGARERERLGIRRERKAMRALEKARQRQEAIIAAQGVAHEARRGAPLDPVAKSLLRLRACLRHLDICTEWEQEFLISISGRVERGELTAKQDACLNLITATLQERARALLTRCRPNKQEVSSVG